MVAKSASKNQVQVYSGGNGTQDTTGLVVAPNKLLNLIAGLSQQEKTLLVNTVAQKATDTELAWFLYMASTYALDPFKKEIWFVKYGDKPNMIVGRDGLLTIAKRNPNYIGLKGATVYAEDEFELDPVENKVIHKQRGKRGGDVIGAWAMALRTDREPVVWFAPVEEYAQNTDVWKRYKSAMILKVAEAFVLRRQFEIEGLYIEEEMPTANATIIDAEVIPEVDDKQQRMELIQQIAKFADQNGVNKAQIRSIREKYTKQTLPSLEHAQLIMAEVEALVVQMNALDEAVEVPNVEPGAEQVGLEIEA